MAINVSAQHNGGLLPDINTADPMLLPSGNPSKCHEEVWSLQPMIPPTDFGISPLTGGCSEGLDAFIFFFKTSPPPNHAIIKLVQIVIRFELSLSPDQD